MLSHIYCVAKIITVLSNPFCRVSSNNMLVFEFLGKESARKRQEAISPLSRTFIQVRNHLRVSRILLDGFLYLLPHQVGFLRCFGMKTGIHFTHFGLESGMVFEGTTGVYERIYRVNSR